MTDAWLRPVEQIVLFAAGRKIRVLGLTSALTDAGVSEVSRRVAEASGNSGTPTLLLDLGNAAHSQEAPAAWNFGQSGAVPIVKPDRRGFDLLPYVPTKEARSAINNVPLVRRSLAEDFARYGTIVVNIPPVLGTADDQVNPVAAAAACDAVLIVCVTGRSTTANVARTVDMLKSAGATIGGTVLNDMMTPTLGSELAREARRLSRLAPKTAAWAERKLMASSFLN